MKSVVGLFSKERRELIKFCIYEEKCMEFALLLGFLIFAGREHLRIDETACFTSRDG